MRRAACCPFPSGPLPDVPLRGETVHPSCPFHFLDLLRKLYQNGQLLVPESRVLEPCEAWHHHKMHPLLKKQALDLQRGFEIDGIGLYNTIKQVAKGCSICQAGKPDDRNVRGQAQWTPIPDQPMESVAMAVFCTPEVHIGKEVFDCVVLCAEGHIGYIVAVLARKKGLLAKELAVMNLCTGASATA